MQYKLAIFDLDGTILDTLTDLMNAFNYGLRRCGLPPRSLDEYRVFVGNGVKKTLERAAPAGTSEQTLAETYKHFTEHYKEHLSDNTKPYNGVADVLCELRRQGIRTAVVSNKDDYGVQALCEKHFPGLFDLCLGVKPGIEKKPAPDGVTEVLSRLKMERDHTVYIGDSEVDAQTAANALVGFIGVGWGFRGEKLLRAAGAGCVVSNAEELLTAVTDGR